MDREPHSVCREIRPVGALYHADIFLSELRGPGGIAKQIWTWKVRPSLCERQEVVDLLVEDVCRARQLTSAGTTQVIDLWREDGQIVVGVESFTGLTLAQVALRAAGADEVLPLDLVLAVLLEATRAVGGAHALVVGGEPFLHGDLRPQNILLSYEGEVKVTGFGFGRFLAAQEPRGFWCTWDGWCYQPPERLLKTARPDPRSDIFSLGLVLGELAGGFRPWGTDETKRLLDALDAALSPLPFDDGGLPDDVRAMISRACSPRPEERYGSAEALAEALHGALYERGHGEDTTALVRRYVERWRSPSTASFEDEDTVTASLTSSYEEVRSVDYVEIPSAPRPSLTVGPFVGREAVQRELERAIVTAAPGRGSAHLILAEPGMGRTRLLAEVARAVATPERHLAWVGVEARPGDRMARLSGVLRCFGALGGISHDQSLVRVGEHADRLRLFGLEEHQVAAVRAAAGVSGATATDQLEAQVGAGLIQALVRLAREQPTVLVWDDLQWVDPASLECLAELLAELLPMGGVALLTATLDFHPRWRDVKLCEHRLGPLSVEETERLVVGLIDGARRLDSDLATAMIAQRGGHPRRLEDTVGLLRQSGRLEVVDGVLRVTDAAALAHLPSIDDVVRATLASMSGALAEIAAASALAAPLFDEELLGRATGRDVAVVGRALNELGRVHRLLVRESGRWMFVSERQRRAVLRASRPERLDRLRAPLARAMLERRGHDHDDDEAAASLLIDANEDAEAAEALVSAGERHEAAGRWEAALRRYLRATEVVERGGPVPLELALRCHLGAGRLASRTMRLEVAEEMLRRAMEIAGEHGELTANAEATISLLELLARQGRLGDVLDVAKDGIPIAEATGEPRQLARAYAAIGEAYQQFGRYGPDLRYIEAAVSFATESRDPLELAHVLRLAVTHAAGVGEDEKTRTLLEQVRPLVEGSEDPALRGHLLKAETLLCIFSRGYGEAVARALEAVELARAHDLEQLEVEMLHNAGDASLRLGAPREASYYFGESLRRAHAGAYDRLVEMNEMYVGFVEAAHQGQDSGLDRIRAALERATASGRIWNLQQGHELLGRALLARGDDAAAAEHLAEALRYARESGVRFFIEEASAALERARQATERRRSRRRTGSSVAAPPHRRSTDGGSDS